MKCKGKTALVTGAAGSGMGRSIALTLAREGANVVVNYHTSAESAAAIVQHIKNQGGKAIAVQADITDPNDCKSLVDATIETFGLIDICLIGPGGGWHPEPIDQINAAAALDDVHRELAPIYHLMPLVLAGMYERNWGRVIALGLSPPHKSPALSYDVGKVARTHAMLRASDTAWGHGVTINTVAPGPVPEIATLEEAIDQCNHGAAWQNRLSTSPQDIAEGVAFLCSEAGDFISGTELPYLFR